ncbi:MAG: hypothetical protein KC910_02670 [Candidatus Eremiobacteraeota bacterium]|nr:hypothetical protein [Candidatus Eremiobacteraeota bacterium]
MKRSCAALIFLVLVGCGGPTKPLPLATVEADTGMVRLRAEGVKIEPSTTPEHIPLGAWYCKMKRVHYARPDRGNGHCEICQMQLTHKEEK